MLTMREKPMKMSRPISRGEGLGRAIATAGKRKSAAWMKVMVEMAVRVVEVVVEARSLAGYAVYNTTLEMRISSCHWGGENGKSDSMIEHIH